MFHKSILLVFLLALAGSIAPLHAADEINQTRFGSKAIDGYDAVAYHTEKKAKKGKKEYAFEWKDAKWFFASSENLETFKKNPNKYAPQYGGYCAWAAAQNKLADTDPKIFDLHDGKLYLNYNKKTQEDWSKDKKNMIQKGDANFPQLIAK